MKKTILILILSVVITYSQDYKISHKSYTYAAKKPKMEFLFNYPQIKGFSSVTAMNMFNKHIENIVYATSDTFKVWMRDWDTISTEHEMGSYYEAGDSVYYASNELVSVQFYEGYYFSGAAHPNNSSFTVNYDLVNFKELTLNDVLKTGWVNKISEICVKDLREQKNVTPETLDDWIQSGAGPDEKNFKVFNITKNGLLITFITYQVGSYAEGPSEVFIEYSKIKDIIKNGGVLQGIVK